MDNPLVIPNVDRVICRGDYNDPIMAALIQRLKYNFWTGLQPALVNLCEPLRTVLGPLPTEMVIIPVPLHWRRRAWRGFNQSDLIAHAIAKHLDRPVESSLQRHRWTTPQAQLDGQSRTTNVCRAFRDVVVAKRPYSAILVDDVITTGSTIAECASVLRQSGVQDITAVALAKG